MTPAEHYEREAREAGELARYRATLEAIIAAAREALNPAPRPDGPAVDQDALPFEEGT